MKRSRRDLVGRGPEAPRAKAATPRSAPPSQPALPPVLWAILLLALGLRLWHLGEGLPDFFEEAFPFRRAFDMAGWEAGHIDWNPHAFHYPSLSFYLHMAVQGVQYLIGWLTGDFHRPADFFLAFQVNPAPMALLARALGVAADVATVVAVMRIGERMRRGTGLLAALLVALSATLVHESHAIVTDGVMTALAVWALERMFAYRASGSWTALAAAAALVGLAAGTKYPAALLTLPLAWAVVASHGRRAWLPLTLALVGATLVFLATSPFLVVSAAQVRFDLLRISDMLREGQLGTFGRPSAFYYLRVFTRDFGWAAPLVLAGSLVWLRRRSGSPRGVAGVWLFLVAFALPMLLGRVEFERYLVPIVPAAALLLALGAMALPDRWPGLGDSMREPARALLVLAIAVPAAWAGFVAAAIGGDTTQAQARRFLETHVTPEELVVQEAHGAPLRDRWDANRMVSSAAFAMADSNWRLRYLSQPALRALRLPLLVAGRAVVVAPDSQVGRREIELFPSSADLNRVFYEPALYAGVDWMLTSDAVRGRYEADSARFQAQHLFYRLLERTADSVATLRSGGTVTGPEIRIYRLGSRFREAVGGALHPLWWTRDVPEHAQIELERAMSSIGAVRGDLDAPPTWVLALGAVFENQIEPFVYPLALELADLGRCDPAMGLAAAILRMEPGHIQATGIIANCAEAQGDLPRARDAVARLLSVRDPAGRSLPDIRLEYARLLAQTGARDEARKQLALVLAAPLSVGPTQRRAREMMDALDRPTRP